MIDGQIVLYGPPGVGKSSLGKRLAQVLKLPFCDLDQTIVAQHGRSVSDIFDAQGEAVFRGYEAAALAQALAAPPGVIALGGGTLLDEANRCQAQAAGQVLCLQAEYETLLQRTLARPESRPLLAGDTAEHLQQLLAQRAGHYASFPLRLAVDGLAQTALVWAVQMRLGRFRVSGMGPAYDAVVMQGGLAQLGAAMQRRGLNGPVALVSDSHVAPLYGQQAAQALQDHGYAVTPVTIPAGEKYKTLDTLSDLWAAFIDAGVERGSTIVALGGGVVGDLTGFAAASYLRGVSWVAVPSTLLAMVDASLGGKTGADLPQGKNLIGAFHPPALVLADPALLASLPEAELCNGMAEALKHGLLGDPGLFDLCAQGLSAAMADPAELVRRAVAVKIGVIGRDPYERGERASLNLGHTLGHAVELVSGFSIKHGEGVAIGMAAAARLAERLGLSEPSGPTGIAQQVQAALENLGLPCYTPPDLDENALAAAMRVDKKMAAGALRIVLPLRPGLAKWGYRLDDPFDLIACGRQP